MQGEVEQMKASLRERAAAIAQREHRLAELEHRLDATGLAEELAAAQRAAAEAEAERRRLAAAELASVWDEREQQIQGAVEKELAALRIELGQKPPAARRATASARQRELDAREAALDEREAALEAREAVLRGDTMSMPSPLGFADGSWLTSRRRVTRPGHLLVGSLEAAETPVVSAGRGHKVRPLPMPEQVNTVDPPDLGLLPTLRRLLRLWWGERRLGALGLSFALAYTLISIAIPLLMQRAIDNAVVAHTQRLWPYVLAIVALGTVRFGINFSRRYATARIGIRIEARMRELLYNAYLRYPRAFYDRHATGQVLSRATNDLYPIRYFIGWGLVQGVQSLMMIVGAGIVLVIVNPRLALYTAVAMPPITWLTLRFARRVSPLSRQVQERKGDVTEAADEAVVGIEMVQAFGREDDVRGRFGERAEAVRNTVLRQAGVEARHLPGLYYLPSLSIAAVVYFGGRQVIAGHLSIGQFVLFETLLLQLVWPLEALGWITNLAQRALASAGRSFAWLEGILPLPEPASPQPLPAGPLSVRFESVHFAYGGEHDVLRDLDLALEPGEIVAVCGPTGSGKTSLLNLLPRFYDATAGRVLVGGVDTRDIAIAELRASVALVTQRPVLFSAPLRENLTAGRDGDWDAVLAACAAAGVDAFVDELPDGYDTLIGERGINLSGGQRQRVALARALVTGARVVVLDDPLSAVDTLTERRLVGRLRPALLGRTVLVATQRLSTIALADRAVVLEEGRIVESGPPDELLRAGGAFTSLFGDELAAA